MAENSKNDNNVETKNEKVREALEFLKKFDKITDPYERMYHQEEADICRTIIYLEKFSI